MGDVVKLVNPEGVGEGVVLSADQILDAAKGNLTECMIIGAAKDGLYVAGTHGAPEMMALLDLAKTWMIEETLKARGWIE